MDADKLEELAARVEALQGPDREVDAEIAEAICWVHRSGQPWALVLPWERPEWTASLDAAMSLAPDGFSGQIWLRFNEGKRHKARAAVWSHDDGHMVPSRFNIEVVAAAPALALTAACLRALAQQEREHASE